MVVVGLLEVLFQFLTLVQAIRLVSAIAAVVVVVVVVGLQIAGYGFPIWSAYCEFQGLDFLSGCPFRLSKRGSQVDG